MSYSKPSNFKGDFYTDAAHLAAYSIDASIYQVMPRVVVCPKDHEDLQIMHQFAISEGLPLIPRGAGTSTTGGPLGDGLIVDMSRYFHRIKSFEEDTGHVRVQPGVVQDHLNLFLRSRNRRFGPDTSTGNRATIGGMAGNNASGAHSIRYGKTIDHIQDMEVLLPSGECVHFNAANGKDTSHPVILKLMDLLKKNEDLILKQFPSVKRNASGYALRDVICSQFNLARLIAGSEGTLGLMTELNVSTVPDPRSIGMGVLLFDTTAEALNVVPGLMQSEPFSLEFIDSLIIQRGLNASFLPEVKGLFPSGTTQSLLVIEFEGDTQKEVLHKQEQVGRFLGEALLKKLNYQFSFDASFKQAVWSLRKMGLSLLMKEQSEKGQAIAFLEDMAVYPHQLNHLIDHFKKCLGTDLSLNMGIYGHAGAGCIHLRPVVDIRDESICARLEEVMRGMTEYLKEEGGVLSGEHGDGFIRSWLNESLYGKELFSLFRQIKQVMDPAGLFNPHKIIGGRKPFVQLRDLYNRKKQGYHFKPYLDFGSGEYAFFDHLSACNGNAQCRKEENFMCPSFQGSQDEYKTTRARAATLVYSMARATEPEEVFNDENKAILDYCLACKGCKSECPSSVDMAKVKAEFLFQYHKYNPRPFQDYLFTSLPMVGKWLPGVLPYMNGVNRLIEKSFVSPLHAKRTFPEFKASKDALKVESVKGDPQVMLFADTFTRFYRPDILTKAMFILRKLEIPFGILPYTCCGRIHLSKGMTEKAEQMAAQMTHSVLPYASRGVPVLFFEPSCLYTVLDDYQNFKHVSFPDEVKHNIMSFLSYMIRHKGASLSGQSPGTIFVQTHCYEHSYHHKSLSHSNLSEIHGDCRQFNTGCCGMAGMFGYDKRLYELSVNIGLKNMPLTINPGTNHRVIADGFSCHSQIKHLFPEVNLCHSTELMHSIFLP